MAYLQWDQQYSVNHSTLDQDHQRFFDLLNNLQESIKHNHGDEAIEVTLKELITYTERHFREEEQYLKQINDPNVEKHIKEHQYFAGELQTYLKEVSEGNIVFLTPQLLYDCITWLHSHIMGTDISIKSG